MHSTLFWTPLMLDLYFPGNMQTPNKKQFVKSILTKRTHFHDKIAL